MHRRSARSLAVLIVAVAFGAPPAGAVRLATTTYSSLCVEAQSGDVAGFRLTLPARGSKSAVLDFGEGPLRRVRVRSFRVDHSTGRVGFVAVDDEPEPATARFVFSGRFVGQALEGALSTPWGASRVRMVATGAGATPPACRERPLAAP